MRRSPIERLHARWVTGYHGHGAAFLLDLGVLVRMWIRWRITELRRGLRRG